MHRFNFIFQVWAQRSLVFQFIEFNVVIIRRRDIVQSVFVSTNMEAKSLVTSSQLVVLVSQRAHQTVNLIEIGLMLDDFIVESNLLVLSFFVFLLLLQLLLADLLLSRSQASIINTIVRECVWQSDGSLAGANVATTNRGRRHRTGGDLNLVCNQGGASGQWASVGDRDLTRLNSTLDDVVLFTNNKLVHGNSTRRLSMSLSVRDSSVKVVLQITKRLRQTRRSNKEGATSLTSLTVVNAGTV